VLKKLFKPIPDLEYRLKQLERQTKDPKQMLLQAYQLAEQGNDHECAQLVKQPGFPVDLQNSQDYNNTMLHIACQKNLHETVSELVRQGASLTVKAA
jgi:ankyrin repeat protein